MSRVLVRNTTEQKVAEVIKEVFDLFKVDLKGKKVLIKPNMVGPHPPERGATTLGCVVKPVLDQVLAQTGQVYVGDNSMSGGQAEDAARESGILQAAGKYYHTLGLEYAETDIGSQLVDKVNLSRMVTEADYLINMPKFKTHILTGMSICIKNMFGCIPGTQKAAMHHRLKSPKTLSQFFVDLYKFVNPELNIVDAITIMEGNGPTYGHVRQLGKIIAGTNGVEVDAVCAAMMGVAPAKFKTLDLAHKAGLGEIYPGKIDIVGDFEVIPGFQLPTTYTAPESVPLGPQDFQNALEEISKARPELREEVCTACGECEDICPAGAMKLSPLPTIDPAKCISCFCCAENCPQGALDAPEMVGRLWEKILNI